MALTFERRRTAFPFLVLLLSMSLVLLGGCKKSSEKPPGDLADQIAQRMVEKAVGQRAKVDVTDEGLAGEGQGVSAEVEQAAVWPEEIPGYVPAFTLGRITAVTKREGTGARSWMIQIADLEEGGFDIYVQMLRNTGWETRVM